MAASSRSTKKKSSAKRKKVVKAEPLVSVAPVTRPRKRYIPAFIGLTREVAMNLWSDKGIFTRLFLVTTIAALLLFGASQQDQYVTTTSALNEYATTLADEGFNGTVQFGILLATAATGGLNTTLSGAQQVYFSLLYILIALTTIWLLRHRMAGASVVVRDGFYQAGAPFVAILGLFFVAVIQLLPLMLGFVVYSAASTSGALRGPLETALFASGALALAALSLYWLSSTLIASIIATNPGTYPFAALKAAKKIVAGRRIMLMVNLVWLAVLVVVLWAVVLVPAVLFDAWVSQPLVPIVVLSVQALTSFSVIFATAYVYLLYRKMIDEPAR